jgi:Flp pilus assembly protein TadG
VLRKAREGGAAAVEFALILPVLLLLVGGVVDLGNMYYNQILMSNAARDGARLIASNPATGGWSSTYIQTRIANSASPVGVSSSAVITSTGTAKWDCGTSGTSITITVTRANAFQWTILGFLPGLPTPTLTGKAVISCS